MRSFSLLFITALSALALHALSAEAASKKIPVILDTDIGDDIDDTWALGLLLKSPELDLKLVTTDLGDTVYRAKIVAKLLEAAGRTDVAVGVGIRQGSGGGRQDAWVAGYDLARYPGKVHQDGVQALIDTIMQSPEPITLICIGPMPNIKAALAKQPEIARRAKFVGMHGSVRVGYGGNKSKTDAEYNVVRDAPACQKAFTAPWPMLITPLDTCGLVHLRGAKYKAVAESNDPVAKAVIENYRAWWRVGNQGKPEKIDASSTLFDTVAVYLAFSTDLVKVERLPIRVTDKGFTEIHEGSKSIDCAVEWKDLAAFEDLLVARLTGK